MFDRETRILEIAKDMCFHADSCTVGAENKCVKLNCETTWLAEKLVDLNYQKISSDNIVISKNEYDRLKLLSEINTDLKQLGTSVAEALSINSSDIERVEKQAKREAIEIFINMAKERTTRSIMNSDGEVVYLDYDFLTIDCLYGIAEELGVKVKDYED